MYGSRKSRWGNHCTWVGIRGSAGRSRAALPRRAVATTRVIQRAYRSASSPAALHQAGNLTAIHAPSAAPSVLEMTSPIDASRPGIRRHCIASTAIVTTKPRSTAPGHRPVSQASEAPSGTKSAMFRAKSTPPSEPQTMQSGGSGGNAGAGRRVIRAMNRSEAATPSRRIPGPFMAARDR